jgi:hypothetical protein
MEIPFDWKLRAWQERQATEKKVQRPSIYKTIDSVWSLIDEDEEEMGRCVRVFGLSVKSDGR